MSRPAGQGTEVRPRRWGHVHVHHVTGGTPAGSHFASLSPTFSSVKRGHGDTELSAVLRGPCGTRCAQSPRRQHVPGSREPETGSEKQQTSRLSRLWDQKPEMQARAALLPAAGADAAGRASASVRWGRRPLEWPGLWVRHSSPASVPVSLRLCPNVLFF